MATFLGTLLALSLPAGLAACATWALAAAIFRYSSLSALVAAAMAPLYAMVFYHLHGSVVIAILAIVIIWRHRDNIARLRAGTEPRIGRK